MANTINDNFHVAAGKPIDDKYLNPTTGQPYGSTATVLSLITTPERYRGLTVLVGSDEYWFKSGVADTDLIAKNSGAISAGTGLTLSGGVLSLGGPLSTNTVLGDNPETYSLDINGAPLTLVSNGTLTVEGDVLDMDATGGSASLNATGDVNISSTGGNVNIGNISYSQIVGINGHVQLFDPTLNDAIVENTLVLNESINGVNVRIGPSLPGSTNAVSLKSDKVTIGRTAVDYNSADLPTDFQDASIIHNGVGFTFGSSFGAVEVDNYSLAGGQGYGHYSDAGAFLGYATYNRIQATGVASFNWSSKLDPDPGETYNASTAGTGTYGAHGDYSAILGGVDHNIPAGFVNSAIIGGNGIVADRSNTVYVPTLIVVSAGTSGNVVFKNLPTSSAGLQPGAVWSDSGTLKIV